MSLLSKPKFKIFYVLWNTQKKKNPEIMILNTNAVKTHYHARHVSVILATWETEIRKIAVRSQA
jgi:hypothetical protein